jgi:hypothetical protein
MPGEPEKMLQVRSVHGYLREFGPVQRLWDDHGDLQAGFPDRPRPLDEVRANKPTAKTHHGSRPSHATLERSSSPTTQVTSLQGADIKVGRRYLLGIRLRLPDVLSRSDLETTRSFTMLTDRRVAVLAAHHGSSAPRPGALGT